ncbi:MAG: polysaccharide deacetylase family protein [Lachnospiraceae bacterium]|nr:polysaccharide deacetylase family protein [Lachnospiraceae bacterium]
MYRFETPKDKRKFISSILQLIVIIALLLLVVRQLFTFVKYEPYDAKDTNIVSGEDHGFIAISYFGVDRESTTSRISVDKLDEQLQALSNLGYVTISQKDIEDYYKLGTPLPDKALFLMYEDGRHDTAVYSQKIMEKYNYKATMFTYADKFTEKDTYFLMPQDLLELEKTGFWEIGSNGYRLSYINVFDRYKRYIGELESTEYSAMAQYFGRDYDHYLMDYIRDANGIPMETHEQMKNRVLGEYALMKEEYQQGLSKVPSAYVLLHSNTGKFGENDKVSAVNEAAIADTFAMNFNREGYSLNVKDCSIYDLTRLEPQANWYTNHLLMRIRDDLPEKDKDNIVFVEGDAEERKHWELVKGAVECRKDDEQLVLTSLPQDTGLCRLVENLPDDVVFRASLKGNKLGSQSVFFRADGSLQSGVEVRLMNNVISLHRNGELLEEVDLYEFDGIPKISVEEDKRDSLSGEYAALSRYAVSHTEAVEYSKMAKEAAAIEVPSVEEGAEEYRPVMQINELGNRKLEVNLRAGKITVKIDDKPVWEEYDIGETKNGGLFLQSAWTEYGYSQRNIADDVYDAVFEEMEITDSQGTVIYTNRLKGVQKGLDFVTDLFNNLVNWFIRNV